MTDPLEIFRMEIIEGGRLVHSFVYRGTRRGAERVRKHFASVVLNRGGMAHAGYDPVAARAYEKAEAVKVAIAQDRTRRAEAQAQAMRRKLAAEQALYRIKTRNAY